jgi:RNA polymerase sigma-70 factor (sigma-E family)
VIEPDGFQEYVKERRVTLVRTGFLLTGDAHSAEDLVQAALIRVWPHWNRVRRDQNVDAYVRKVLMNVFLSSVRRRRWREIPAGLEAADSYADAGDGHQRQHQSQHDAYAGVDDRLAMVHLLRVLPPRQRAVVVARYYLDLSEADCSQLLGCSAGTIKSQTSKAMRTLGAAMAPDPSGQGTTIGGMSDE